MANWRVRLFIAATLLAAPPAAAQHPQLAAAQYPQLAPAGEGFSVEFPANPTFRPDSPSGSVIAHGWSASQGGYMFFVGRAVPKDSLVSIDADSTLKGDQDDVVSGLKAKLLRSDRLTWPGPDGPLPALLFAVRVGNGYAEYLETINGRVIVSIMVLARTDSKAARDEVDRLVRTLQITR